MSKTQDDTTVMEIEGENVEHTPINSVSKLKFCPLCGQRTEVKYQGYHSYLYCNEHGQLVFDR